MGVYIAKGLSFVNDFFFLFSFIIDRLRIGVYNLAVMKKKSDIFTEERHRKIIEVLSEQRRVTVKELCEHFDVSMVTVRNDLNELQKHGKLVRTHGGAMAIDGPALIPSFDVRRQTSGESKRAIGKAAAGLVEDGEVIFIDAGTTAAEMPPFLTEKKDITIITPGLAVAYWLIQNTPFNVYMLNGFINRKSCGTIGEPYEGFMSEWIISKAFCGAAGFTLNEGLTDNHIGFVEQKRIIAKKAKVTVGLVDSTKFGKVSLGCFAKAEEVNVIVTDRSISRETLAEIEARGIEVVVA
jgi:DeoR/GlpR family transcriptional regulator of sugar metabolism